MTEFYKGGFGLASMPREGDIANPDDFTWECDRTNCPKCRAYYENWKQKYIEQEQRYDAERELRSKEMKDD